MTRARQFWNSVKELLIWGGLGFTGAVLLVTFSFQLLHVPSKSMLPTLEVGDRILVTKTAYGFSKNSLPHLAYRLLFFLPNLEFYYSAPQRGDVVVFRPPQEPDVYYVKRVIGLPGDTVQLKNNLLLVNGQELDYQQLSTITWRETNLDNISYRMRRITGYLDQAGPFIVPAGEYFVMGDNRPFSKDSRFAAVGTIPLGNIIGRVDRILYALTDNVRGSLYFWDWSGFNRQRLFKKVGE